MGIFAAIMDKIFHHPAAQPGHAAAPAAPPAEAPAAAAPAPEAASAPAPAAEPVDVEAVLDKMAQDKGGDAGNYDSSIVDLLKLLDLDSSLDARKQLADELNCQEGEPGTAEENIALHKAVMAKLAENGGKVPAGMS